MILSEYVQMMKPSSLEIDILQGEKQMHSVLPSLLLILQCEKKFHRLLAICHEMLFKMVSHQGLFRYWISEMIYVNQTISLPFFT